MSAPDSELSVDQRNALQEIANIGMGQAGASIAKIWGEFVRLSIPKIAHVERTSIPGLLARVVGSAPVDAVRQAFHGQLRGEVVVVFADSNVSELAELMGYDSSDAVEQHELLLDVANILVGACLGSVARTLEAEIGFSAPSLMGVDVKPENLVQRGDLGAGRALVLEICFTLEKRSFSSHLVVLMPAEEIAVLAKRLDQFLEAY